MVIITVVFVLVCLFLATIPIWEALDMYFYRRELRRESKEFANRLKAIRDRYK